MNLANQTINLITNVNKGIYQKNKFSLYKTLKSLNYNDLNIVY